VTRALRPWFLLPTLLALLAMPHATPPPALGAERGGPRVVTAVAAVGMTVSDMERSLEVYRDILEFESVSDAEFAGDEAERLTGVFGARVRVVTLRLGTETIELTEFLAPAGRPMPADFRSNDRWFQHLALVVSDMSTAYARLREHRVRHASSGPQRLPDWNPNAGGIEAFYFRDPDGHHLEVIAYPAGKGAPRWQEDGRLFLGIDHTAIVVADTEASLAFYRDTLGLDVAGASENYGTEQEHLNNVFGARLRITALRASGGGPGIEFLEYLSPRDGRPMPSDERANDLIHWHVRLVTSDAAAAYRATRTAKAPLVSPGFVDLTDERWTFRKGLRLRDPDGHVLEVIER
jgi:catechol 2,3-dioxygenase-like lactoylglutathione lyase family enzyme